MMKRLRDGFTLIEILIVIAIIGLLVAFLAPRFIGQAEGAKISVAQVGLRQVQTQINKYKFDTGRYPTSLLELVERPQDERASKKWRGPYIDELPEDPWGQEYTYRKTSGGAHAYELYSDGPDDGEQISVWDK